MAQSLTYLLNEQARLIADINSVTAQLNYARTNANPSIVAGLEDRLASDQSALSEIQNEIQALQTQVISPTDSAGDIVTESQAARDSNAYTENPVTAPVPLEVPGRITPNNVETGTDGTLRTLDTTQSTPPLNLNNTDPLAAQNIGVGASRDDNTAPNSTNTAQMLNASFNQAIVPQPNVLDAYSSYTYAISWYLLTPDQYNEINTTQKKNCASWQLLMQSGGAPTQLTGGAIAGRNQFFSLDYYMDNLEIDSLVPLKGTNAANTATSIRFTVTEPNGITLLTNLYQAVDTLYKQNNISKVAANYPMAQYCLAIRFYGYDSTGKLATTAGQGNNNNNNTNLTDPRAIVEKFYPFVIQNIKFRVANKVIEYTVDGKPIPHFYNKSQDRGTIPFAFELTGDTVEQILVGKPVGTATPASPGERNTTPNPTPGAPTNLGVTDLSLQQQSAIASGSDNVMIAGGDGTWSA